MPQTIRGNENSGNKSLVNGDGGEKKLDTYGNNIFCYVVTSMELLEN